MSTSDTHASPHYDSVKPSLKEWKAIAKRIDRKTAPDAATIHRRLHPVIEPLLDLTSSAGKVASLLVSLGMSDDGKVVRGVLAHGSLEGWEESEEGKTALESLANWYRTRQGPAQHRASDGLPPIAPNQTVSRIFDDDVLEHIQLATTKKPRLEELITALLKHEGLYPVQANPGIFARVAARDVAPTPHIPDQEPVDIGAYLLTPPELAFFDAREDRHAIVGAHSFVHWLNQEEFLVPGETTQLGGPKGLVWAVYPIIRFILWEDMWERHPQLTMNAQRPLAKKYLVSYIDTCLKIVASQIKESTTTLTAAFKERRLRGLPHADLDLKLEIQRYADGAISPPASITPTSSAAHSLANLSEREADSPEPAIPAPAHQAKSFTGADSSLGAASNSVGPRQDDVMAITGGPLKSWKRKGGDKRPEPNYSMENIPQPKRDPKEGLRYFTSNDKLTWAQSGAGGTDTTGPSERELLPEPSAEVEVTTPVVEGAIGSSGAVPGGQPPPVFPLKRSSGKSTTLSAPVKPTRFAQASLPAVPEDTKPKRKRHISPPGALDDPPQLSDDEEAPQPVDEPTSARVSTPHLGERTGLRSSARKTVTASAAASRAGSVASRASASNTSSRSTSVASTSGGSHVAGGAELDSVRDAVKRRKTGGKTKEKQAT